MKSTKSYPIVLSIAGSDSSGGAGVQADLKTFSVLGVYGATAITAITAQNTLGVKSQYALDPQLVYEQIVTVIEDLEPSVVKIGMLSNEKIVAAVAEALGHYDLEIILDPVIVSSSGHRLLSLEAQETIKERLLPLCELITPNIPEMIALTGMSVSNLEEKEKAADHLLNLGVKSVLLKGGHEEGEMKTDFLFYKGQQTTVVQQMCREYGATFIIDDNVHLCKKIKADGVHLGKNDMPVAEAHEILSGDFIIGATVNTFEDILSHVGTYRIRPNYPNYFGCGPFRFTSTKKNLAPILGLEGFKNILEKMRENDIDIPLVAIGGITKDDIPELINVGVDGIAMSGSILRAEKPVEEINNVQFTICRNSNS